MAEILDYQSAHIPGSEEGVYYAQSDLAKLPVRLVVSVIDLLAIIGITIALVSGLPLLWERLSNGGIPPILLFLLWWAYLVLLKRSGIGTVGYWIFGLKIVTLKGERPGLLRLTLRTVVAMWFNPVVDLFWLAGDDSRQALRDKLCGTYVVRRTATPAGCGKLTYARVFIVGTALIFREVSRQAI